jgi:hypothetical protein
MTLVVVVFPLLAVYEVAGADFGKKSKEKLRSCLNLRRLHM